ncbi:prostaglandin E2 receptor EP4 subtype [Aplysia californica]|uniref:Prostaglandin E2 receptor EP4 subtype n=1 Tax=Aplysia californica TaxID=6500 RepID=A0ABM0ZXH9_APLCA|nr:prostaglandin E2 receptor EP4 subtype [Aplysia californica]
MLVMDETTLSTLNHVITTDDGNMSQATAAIASVFQMNQALRNQTVLVSSLMFASGVVGNVLALVLMATSPIEQRRTTFYKLMAGLSVTDLFGTCATSPVVISIYATGKLMKEVGALCNYFSFMMIFAGFATMLVVCAMAIERYICVCHPYTYHCKLPKSYARYSLCVSWVFAAFMASLPLMGFGRNAVQFPPTWCYLDLLSKHTEDIVYNYLFGIISLLAILLTFLCNCVAIVSVLSLRRRQRELGASQNGGVRRPRSLVQRCAEMHMVVMLMGVTIVFTSCFGPLMIFTLICQTGLQHRINIPMTYLLIVRIASFNPILDPWVYILVRRELRWKIIGIFRYILGMSRPTSNIYYPNQDCESPIAPTRRPEPEVELSFWKFCLRCLCDPPAQRYSSSLARPSITWATQTNRSPSYIRRLPSSDSLLSGGPGGIMITQPSPSEELLLERLSNSNKKQNGSANGVHKT